MKEEDKLVTIQGRNYRYSHKEGATVYLGPVSDDLPLEMKGCPECGAVLSDKHNLILHLKSHGATRSKIGTRHIVKLRGHHYKYTKDEDGNINFLGPVAGSLLITEQQFRILLKEKNADSLMTEDDFDLQEEEASSISLIDSTLRRWPNIVEEKPCNCGEPYLKQGKIWWCPKCKENFVVVQ